MKQLTRGARQLVDELPGGEGDLGIWHNRRPEPTHRARPWKPLEQLILSVPGFLQ